MKKLTALFLAVLMLLGTSAAVFAAGDAPDGALLRGDANGDGDVTAADARMILRIAAQLDSSDGLVFAVLDVDESGDITAQDARSTLRVAAMLDEFEKGKYVTLPADETTTAESSSETEPTSSEQTTAPEPTTLPPVTTTQTPEPEEPADVQIIHSGTYEMVLECTMGSDTMKLMLAEKKGNLCLRIVGNESQPDCDVLMIDGALYLACAIDSKSSAKMLISETGLRAIIEKMDDEQKKEFSDYLDMMDEMKTMLSLISNLIPEELGEPSKCKENGVEYLVYSYESCGLPMQLYVDGQGRMRKILLVDTNYEDDEYIIDSVSGELSENYFDIKNKDKYVLFA